MNSNMVKLEKLDHVYLVYHFTVPLKTKKYIYNISLEIHLDPSHTDTLVLPDNARWISSEMSYIYFLVQHLNQHETSRDFIFIEIVCPH